MRELTIQEKAKARERAIQLLTEVTRLLRLIRESPEARFAVPVDRTLLIRMIAITATIAGDALGMPLDRL